MNAEPTFAGNMDRFTGFAGQYDEHRAAPPGRMASLLMEISGTDAGGTVVDLGCGTGLSSRYWIGKIAHIIGIEPTDSMRVEAERRGGEGVRYLRGFSHETGLADASADIVTCVQALHWMDPQGTFAEAARILRPGGIFAACDYDWPPVTGIWEVDQAYADCDRQARALERDLGLADTLEYYEKSGHLARMHASGAFRWVREIVLHEEDEGDAERLVGLALSQGGVQTLLKAGLSEEEIGISRLRDQATSLMPDKKPWLWSSRLRLGVV